MQNFEINVAQIEELQMIENRSELDRIFAKAKTAVVSGALVLLYRKTAGHADVPFDEITTEADLNVYKDGVYKYLAP